MRKVIAGFIYVLYSALLVYAISFASPMYRDIIDDKVCFVLTASNGYSIFSYYVIEQ